MSLGCLWRNKQNNRGLRCDLFCGNSELLFSPPWHGHMQPLPLYSTLENIVCSFSVVLHQISRFATSSLFFQSQGSWGVSWYPFWGSGQWTSSTDDESLIAHLFIGYFCMPVYLYTPKFSNCCVGIHETWSYKFVLGHTPHFTSKIYTQSKCTGPGTCFQQPST